MTATLKQTRKLLETLGDVSLEQLQAINGSGVIADLRDGDLAKFNREVFRKMLGLGALVVPNMTITIVASGALTPPGEKWTLLEDSESPVGTLTLELAEFLNNGETSVGGETMFERSKRIGRLGERHARALHASQSQIPEEWRKYVLLFPGTVWQDPSGCRDVCCLIWRGSGWRLYWAWLRYDYDAYCRLVRPC